MALKISEHNSISMQSEFSKICSHENIKKSRVRSYEITLRIRDIETENTMRRVFILILELIGSASD